MRYHNENLKDLIGIQTDVLPPSGYVRLVDYMGGDEAIVQGARVSHGQDSKGAEKDANLIGYLMRNRHTSPFEMCEIKFHISAPIFIARQWVRHRTANWNEISGRYSVIRDEFYVPPVAAIGAQSGTNKQGTEATLSPNEQNRAHDIIRQRGSGAYRTYRKLLAMGVSREIARMVLPLNIYTEWYWKIDLHNLFHFLGLRNDSHAQGEMQQYAQVIEEVVALWVPVAYAAYKEHGYG